MTGGKSTHLIRSYQKSEGVKEAYKPRIDNRFVLEEITTHDGVSIPAKPVAEVEEILMDVMEKNVEVIAIDEVQFFNQKNEKGEYKIVRLIETLKAMDKKIILAGLDRDFRGEIFGPMDEVMTLSDQVFEHMSICAQCRDDATLTQRLVNGEPAYYNDPVVLVGSTKENQYQERYEPRCIKCHEVKPGSRV